MGFLGVKTMVLKTISVVPPIPAYYDRNARFPRRCKFI